MSSAASPARAGRVNRRTGGFSGGRGALIIHANETWSTTAQSTYIQFNTTALGTAYQAERMRIDNAGNVGIGTTSPTHTLDVDGTGNFTGPVTVQGNVQVNGNLSVAGIQAGGIAGGIVTHGDADIIVCRVYASANDLRLQLCLHLCGRQLLAEGGIGCVSR